MNATDKCGYVPSLEYLTAVMSIKLFIAVSMEMSRRPRVLERCLYIFVSNWSDLRQFCKPKIMLKHQVHLRPVRTMIRLKGEKCN